MYSAAVLASSINKNKNNILNISMQFIFCILKEVLVLKQKKIKGNQMIFKM